jgi:hypothetical protein
VKLHISIIMLITLVSILMLVVGDHWLGNQYAMYVDGYNGHLEDVISTMIFSNRVLVALLAISFCIQIFAFHRLKAGDAANA